MAVAAATGRGGAEALAGGNNNNKVAANSEEEWVTTGSDASLSDIIFCGGSDCGVVLFWWHGQGPIEGF